MTYSQWNVCSGIRYTFEMLCDINGPLRFKPATFGDPLRFLQSQKTI